MLRAEPVDEIEFAGHGCILIANGRKRCNPAKSTPRRGIYEQAVVKRGSENLQRDVSKHLFGIAHERTCHLTKFDAGLIQSDEVQSPVARSLASSPGPEVRQFIPLLLVDFTTLPDVSQRLFAAYFVVKSFLRFSPIQSAASLHREEGKRSGEGAVTHSPWSRTLLGGGENPWGLDGFSPSPGRTASGFSRQHSPLLSMDAATRVR